jgi:hypothetical protein
MNVDKGNVLCGAVMVAALIYAYCQDDLPPPPPKQDNNNNRGKKN